MHGYVWRGVLCVLVFLRENMTSKNNSSTGATQRLTEGQTQALNTALLIVAGSPTHDTQLKNVIIEQLRPLLNPSLSLPSYEEDYK